MRQIVCCTSSHSTHVVFTITSVKLLALYLLLEASEVFLHGMLPATLLDIESEIHVLLFQKNRVSGSKLSNLQFMFIVSSVP